MPEHAKPSVSVEDFVKAIYVLQQQSEGRISTNALAAARDISAPSVTDMAQRLMDAGLVDYQRYKGVLLTEEGEQVAIKILRRHRLIETYLVDELSYELHEVHTEAENLEHAVSDRFIEAIAHKLGEPEFDPHGDPIPLQDGSMTSRDLHPLSTLPLNTPARVSRFMTSNPEMLQHAMQRGFAMSSVVNVSARDPFEGPLTVQLKDTETVIGHNLAASILVEVIEA